MNRARQKLAELVESVTREPTMLQVAKALKELRGLDATEAGLKRLRIGVVSSFTFDVLVNPLVVAGYCGGFEPEVYNAPFGQYIQELINPESGLHRFRPDATLVAVRLQDACPSLYEGFNALRGEDVDSMLGRWQEEFFQAISTFRSISGAQILCTNYEQPAFPSLGAADRDADLSQRAVVERANHWLWGLRERLDDFQVIDVDELIARHGRANWTDPKTWFWAKVPIASIHHWAYVRRIMQALQSVKGHVRKVLALDCDNTLWGGVLGEVGRDGIAIGHDYPGNAFAAFQKRILELHHRGVVLVIASKNQHEAVMDVFENHPEMILRPRHIAYFGVNWDPKPENLVRAAESLNLGIDSFVFMDDHPVECELVRNMLPEVLTIRLPEDPAAYAQALCRLDDFDQATISVEDRRRGQMYKAEAERSAFRAGASDLESFYRGLEMRIILSRNAASSVARAAQLTQRTNQFNMTTIRRSESEISALMREGRSCVYTIRLLDRFGDAGLVGLAIVEHDGAGRAIIETFLMSCRVLGRKVEDTFLAWIGGQALAAGRSTLTGLYRKTSKNAPFAGFYKSVGMQLEGTGEDGTERWSCALSADEQALKVPSWIAIEEM